MTRELIPNATLSDRTALALFAWHAMLSNASGYGDGCERISKEAFNHADAMLEEIGRQEMVR